MTNFDFDGSKLDSKMYNTNDFNYLKVEENLLVEMSFSFMKQDEGRSFSCNK